MVGLVWHNEPGWDQHKAEAAIWTDLEVSIHTDLLDKPSNLITHTVFLGPSMDQGPVIHMWGEEGDDENLHCEWADEITWLSMDEVGEADER